MTMLKSLLWLITTFFKTQQKLFLNEKKLLKLFSGIKLEEMHTFLML